MGLGRATLESVLRTMEELGLPVIPAHGPNGIVHYTAEDIRSMIEACQ